ncbi:ParB/RepB/Spo0J family partition protein [Streptomyces sp. NPDC058861]|uniref:ParB/RepB/Spo0J family partition protein n=1 Tax=Streptomyces sp. NPDC058861 TaxID=3346653 RepID=UPI0036B04940
MSKAKNLGAGSSFAQARPISARRAAIGAATAAPTEGVPDPTELPLGLISQNPDNPREELRDLEGLADSIREIGLVNSITVATVDSYLAERPERAEDVDEGARYIVVDGHRRLEAARLAGAAVIRVSVNNHLVATDEALLEAAFVANVHRDDMNPIEQAHALKKLVEFYGSQNKAAKRLGIGQSTISSKLSILDLDHGLQADLVEGRRTIEHVRNLSKLPPEQQRAKADARAEAAEQRSAAKRDLSRRDNPQVVHEAPVSGEAGVTDGSASGGSTPGEGVSGGGVPGGGISGGGVVGGGVVDLSRRDNPGGDGRGSLVDEVPAPRSAKAAPSVAQGPAPVRVAEPFSVDGGAAVVEAPVGERSGASWNTAAPAAPAVPEVPLHDGVALMDLAFDRLDPGQRGAFIQHYFKRSTGVGAVIADMRGDLAVQDRNSLAAILEQVASGLREGA